MIDNPNEWVNDFADYIINPKPSDFYFGEFCVISKSAPENAVEAYKKYIKLISHTLQSWDEVIIEDWTIKGFKNSDCKEVEKQIKIIEKLLDDGIISRNIKH